MLISFPWNLLIFCTLAWNYCDLHVQLCPCCMPSQCATGQIIQMNYLNKMIFLALPFLTISQDTLPCAAVMTYCRIDPLNDLEGKLELQNWRSFNNPLRRRAGGGLDEVSSSSGMLVIHLKVLSAGQKPPCGFSGPFGRCGARARSWLAGEGFPDPALQPHQRWKGEQPRKQDGAVSHKLNKIPLQRWTKGVLKGLIVGRCLVAGGRCGGGWLGSCRCLGFREVLFPLKTNKQTQLLLVSATKAFMSGW